MIEIAMTRCAFNRTLIFQANILPQSLSFGVQTWFNAHVWWLSAILSPACSASNKRFQTGLSRPSLFGFVSVTFQYIWLEYCSKYVFICAYIICTAAELVLVGYEWANPVSAKTCDSLKTCKPRYSIDTYIYIMMYIFIYLELYRCVHAHIYIYHICSYSCIVMFNIYIYAVSIMPS